MVLGPPASTEGGCGINHPHVPTQTLSRGPFSARVRQNGVTVPLGWDMCHITIRDLWPTSNCRGERKCYRPASDTHVKYGRISRR